MFKVPEQYRITNGPYGSTPEDDGNNGAFRLTLAKSVFLVIASDGLGWEHVSAHCMGEPYKRRDRMPTWAEMCAIKDLFWDKADLVVQYMVPADDHIDLHRHTLHMWRKAGTNDFCQRPPSILV